MLGYEYENILSIAIIWIWNQTIYCLKIGIKRFWVLKKYGYKTKLSTVKICMWEEQKTYGYESFWSCAKICIRSQIEHCKNLDMKFNWLRLTYEYNKFLSIA